MIPRPVAVCSDALTTPITLHPRAPPRPVTREKMSRAHTLSDAFIFVVVALTSTVDVAHAAKCTCAPPSDAAKAVGWWSDTPPVVRVEVPKRTPDGGGGGGGGLGSDEASVDNAVDRADTEALTRQLTMDENDLKGMLRENAVQNAILLMFANLGALQLLENYLCSLSEQGINKYLIYAMDVESHMVRRTTQ